MSNVCSAERPPRYRRHKKSGQAVATFNGRDIYFGKYGTAASCEQGLAIVEPRSTLTRFGRWDIDRGYWPFLSKKQISCGLTRVPET